MKADANDVGGGRRAGEGSDRRNAPIVEDRVPGQPAIDGLPHPTRRGAPVVGHRIADHAGDGAHPIADRPNVAALELRVVAGLDVLRDGGHGYDRDESEGTDDGDTDGAHCMPLADVIRLEWTR